MFFIKPPYPDAKFEVGSGATRYLRLPPDCLLLAPMKGIWTILLLVFSNTFMTIAWYGQLKMQEFKWFKALPLFAVILISWGIAFFEYTLMVPANRMGYRANGGPFTLVQLKVIQEAITLMVFMVFSITFFKNEPLRTNHLIGFVFLVLAVYFIFKE